MKTIDKAVALLDRMAEEPAALGVTELSKATGLDKAVVHGLLRSLVDNGLAEQVPEGRKYRLGAKMLRFGYIRQASLPVVDCARETVRWLRDTSGESAQMSLFLGDRMQVAVVYECDLPSRVGFRIGRELPLHCTAAGLAVLGALPEEVAETLMAGPFSETPERPDQLMDPGRVRELVDEARRSGVSFAEKTYTLDVSSVGAPILEASGRPIAALAVAGPVHRVDRDRMEAFARLVRGAALEVSRAMGYGGAARAA